MDKMVLKFFPILCLAISLNAYGFVLISGPSEAKLGADELSPQIIFQGSTDIPSIKDKDKFLDGQYAQQGDQEFYGTLIQLALDQWNNVSTSYIQLAYEFNDNAQLDSEDRIHTVAKASVNLVAAATASPQYEDGIIYDCDISLGSRSQSAESLAYTLMHEFGHCLGLGHNHSDPNAVMGYTRSNLELSLGADDIFGLSYLYPPSNLGKPKELIACGSLGTSNSSASLSLLALLACPLGLMLLRDS